MKGIDLKIMVLKVKEFQVACKSILEAVDSSSNSIVSETLELISENGKLSLNVTNKEYFVKVMYSVENVEEFHATVDAKIFLSLISKITTDEIELFVKDNSLVIKGNGNYKLPLIFDDLKLVELTPIVVDNPTTQFTINSDVLHSILNYNSKELNKGVISRPVQKMYYVDEQGAITFTQGACVNSFTLESPIRLLLTNKLVKLFKLFPKDTNVAFALGFDDNRGFTQEKVSFKNDSIEITSILTNDESMLNTVPVNAIRSRANSTYTNSININKETLMSSIDRLLLFANASNGFQKTNATFDFGVEGVTIKVQSDGNEEYIAYTNTSIETPYTTMLDLNDLRVTLESCQEQYLTMHFGDGQAIVISRGNVKNVIPEVHLA